MVLTAGAALPVNDAAALGEGLNRLMAAVQSMTGYGRTTTRAASGSVTVEVRSTNHRYLEVESRLPNGLTALQGRLTELVRTRVRRGRVEVSIFIHAKAGDQRQVTFDRALVARYYRALVDLKTTFRLSGAVTLDHLLALPQALTVTEERTPADRLWEPIRQATEPALQQLVRTRQREGTKLTRDLRRQIQAIARHLQAIKRRLPVALQESRQQLRERLQELLGKGTCSAAQLAEAAAFVKESDVHEEAVRLESHLTHMRQTLQSGQLVGKQLDFIAQELMRETNTMGAKANDPIAARHVVEMKGCIEKIREQGQNLE